MRKVVFAILVGAASLAVGLAALMAFNLRVFVDVHREELVARAERALERPLRVGALGTSWWPPGIRFTGIAIGEDPRFGTAPFLDATAVRIAVRLWPLLEGRVELAGVRLERPRIALRRDERGRWNVASLGAAAADGRERGQVAGGGRPHAPRVPLEWIVGVALSEVRDGRVEIEDRAGATPRRFTAERVRLRAEDVRFGGEARVWMEAALFGDRARPDARLDLRIARLGENDTRRTPFSARLALQDADLGVLAAWTGATARPAGRIAALSADASGTLDELAVTLEARAAEHTLGLGRRVTLPAGALQARGRYARGLVTLEEASAVVGSLTLGASGSFEPQSSRGRLRVWTIAGSTLALGTGEPPLDVSDLELALTLEGGGARLDSGRLRLDGVPVALTGELRGLDPPALAGGFEAGAFGGSVAGNVSLDPSGRLAVAARCTGIDLAAATARLAPSLEERLSGRAEGSVALVVPLDAAVPARALAGSGTVAVRDLYLRRLNVADRVLGNLHELRLVPRLVSAHTRARYPEVFASEDTRITTATVPFTVAGGRIASDALVVSAEPYEVVGGGWIDLERQVRFHGDLILSAALSAALRSDLPATRYLVDDGGRVSIPFRVHGVLGRAQPEPDLKRLRARGLRALRGHGADRGASRLRPPPAEPVERDGERPDEAVLDRLQQMFRP